MITSVRKHALAACLALAVFIGSFVTGLHEAADERHVAFASMIVLPPARNHPSFRTFDSFDTPRFAAQIAVSTPPVADSLIQDVLSEAGLVWSEQETARAIQVQNGETSSSVDVSVTTTDAELSVALAQSLQVHLKAFLEKRIRVEAPRSIPQPAAVVGVVEEASALPLPSKAVSTAAILGAALLLATMTGWLAQCIVDRRQRSDRLRADRPSSSRCRPRPKGLDQQWFAGAAAPSHESPPSQNAQD